MTRGPITLDSARHRVLVGGKPVVLTAVEFKLLSMLMHRPGRVAGARPVAERSLGLRKRDRHPHRRYPCAPATRETGQISQRDRNRARLRLPFAREAGSMGLARICARARNSRRLLVARPARLDRRPARELERMVRELNEGQSPRTFLIGGSPTVRGTALALEQLALREGELRTRAQEGEFGVQAIVEALADGLVVADGERRIRLDERCLPPTVSGSARKQPVATLLETVRDAAVERSLGEALAAAGAPCHDRAPATGGGRTPSRSGGGADQGRPRSRHPRFATSPSGAGRKRCGATSSPTSHTSCARRFRSCAVISRRLLENPEQPPAELLRIFEVMERSFQPPQPPGRRRPQPRPARGARAWRSTGRPSGRRFSCAASCATGKKNSPSNKSRRGPRTRQTICRTLEADEAALAGSDLQPPR